MLNRVALALSNMFATFGVSLAVKGSFHTGRLMHAKSTSAKQNLVHALRHPTTQARDLFWDPP